MATDAAAIQIEWGPTQIGHQVTHPVHVAAPHVTEKSQALSGWDRRG